ncbi:MAG: GNAT family N-acetyltransferase [Theionarchaea archaeon]|nr:GNAT family N-acetyltransferase [Theionarchaea archaeon]
MGRFVVAKRTTVVGMAAVFPYQSCAWIGHMVVEPDLQRKGIGTLLMDELLHILEKGKIDAVKLDSTDLGRHLYTKYNFKEECKVLQYEIHKNDAANFEGVCITEDRAAEIYGSYRRFQGTVKRKPQHTEH